MNLNFYDKSLPPIASGANDFDVAHASRLRLSKVRKPEACATVQTR